jgi:hypothetical protein
MTNRALIDASQQVRCDSRGYLERTLGKYECKPKNSKAAPSRAYLRDPRPPICLQRLTSKKQLVCPEDK